MTAAPARAGSNWLALRERADAAARSVELVEQIGPLTGSPVLIHDLGCGTGSMARWLAPRLSGRQHWILSDRDGELLDQAATAWPITAVGGTAISGETRCRDITRLSADDLAGASLITASALLDMLTAAELNRLIMAATSARCPVLISLSVIGRVEFSPADPADDLIAAAFNAHQRRHAGSGSLLGPDAASAAADAFGRRGYEVIVRPTPWRLTASADEALLTEWFAGWIGAAREHDPALSGVITEYTERRIADVRTGRLGVTVHHVDLLARPR